MPSVMVVRKVHHAHAVPLTVDKGGRGVRRSVIIIFVDSDVVVCLSAAVSRESGHDA